MFSPKLLLFFDKVGELSSLDSAYLVRLVKVLVL